ncbi:hypothetical protein LTR84_008639 [Exophiala bonariae]|uniref:Methyltransferase domain-containing protein n=1 Tax=Exophiala bonariae TaxID=1690606 RepID=A0AAV9N015_9EURO|nr:hypothetical protein LTR84_008639 [Exophiala bonariae]
MDQAKNPDEKPSQPPVHSVLHETRTAENSATHLLPKLQALKELNPKLSLLDVGSGSGTISVSFAKLIPEGHVTGVDLNPNILPRARAVAEIAGVTNIEFQQGSIYKLPFADETFDVTFCHQVLIHIANPWDALCEMLRVTKRGGVVAAREGDYETECVWPEVSELQRFHKLMASLMSANGGAPTAGRQLLSWALKAGADRSQITLSFSSWSYTTPSERSVCAQGLCSPLRGGSLREKALKHGLGTEDDFEKMANAWEKWAKTEDASLAMLNGEILIQK